MSGTRRRLAAAVAAMLGAVLLMVAGAGAASAGPYRDHPGCITCADGYRHTG